MEKQAGSPGWLHRDYVYYTRFYFIFFYSISADQQGT